MKKNFIAIAAAVVLLSAPAAVTADAAETEGQSAESGMLMPSPKKKSAKKTTKKTTKKSTSSKKTTSKKSTSSKTATTTKAAEPQEETTSGSSQNILGGILSGIAGGSGSSVASALSTIFDKNKVATADELVGTWKYTEPAVVFESNNALKNIGGKVASAAIEKKLQSEFSKFGIRKGQMKMTFDKDGNFTQTVGRQTLTGTYTTSGKQFVQTYTTGFEQLGGTTQLDGNDLLIDMDVSKLLKYAGSLGQLTGNSTISSLGSLLGSYDGMEVGLKLEK